MSEDAMADDGFDADMRAAEYVVGTLDAAERAAVSLELGASASMRAAVARWETKLGPLAGSVTPVRPPAALWAAIEAGLPRGAPVLTTIEGGRMRDGGVPSSVADASRPADVTRALVRWRRTALTASAIAAALAIYVAQRALLPSAGPSESLVAAVNRGGDQPALIVRVDLKTGTVFVRPVAAQAPIGKSLELWYIGAGKPPQSMGLVTDATYRRSVPEGATLESGLFAVTVEQPGGAPNGVPTSAPIYSGKLIRE